MKTYVFIDATNIIYGASDSGWRVNFEKLIHYLKTRFEAVKIFYFAGLDQENLKQLKFYEKMQSFGYELRLVPVKKFKDGKKKADGDGDFYWILEYLLQNKKVRLFGHLNSTARELKKLFQGEYIPLANIRKQIELKTKNEADTTNVSASEDYANRVTQKNKKVKKKGGHK